MYVCVNCQKRDITSDEYEGQRQNLIWYLFDICSIYLLIFVNCIKMYITRDADEGQHQNLIYRGWPTV